MQISYSVDALREIVNPVAVRGNAAGGITGIASLKEAQSGDLSFLGNTKYRKEVEVSAASVILLPPDFEGEPSDGQCFLIVDNPSAALAALCARIEQSLWPRPAPGVHRSAVIGDDCEIDPTATIGPLCVLESGARIGRGTHLQAQVYVGREAVIGRLTPCQLLRTR